VVGGSGLVEKSNAGAVGGGLAAFPSDWASVGFVDLASTVTGFIFLEFFP
jgi:hypothetical protein